MQVLPLERDTRGKTGIIKKLQQDEPDLVLSLRAAGDMRFGSDQRSSLLLHMPIEPARLYSLQQVHSHAVYTSGPEISADLEGDGLVAGDPEHVLTVSVADCMPIFLFHAAARRFAVVHSGWKGTGIALQALQQLREPAGQPVLPVSEITAVLGPSIRSCCYRVDKERAALFVDRWGADSVVWRGDDGSNGAGSKAEPVPYLDLLQANLHSLEAAGVQDIRYVDECTACTADLGSFRREGPQQFTHMLAMIGYFK
jgi:polyphenol oxidase